MLRDFMFYLRTSQASLIVIFFSWGTKKKKVLRGESGLVKNLIRRELIFNYLPSSLDTLDR